MVEKEKTEGFTSTVSLKNNGDDEKCFFCFPVKYSMMFISVMALLCYPFQIFMLFKLFLNPGFKSTGLVLMQICFIFNITGSTYSCYLFYKWLRQDNHENRDNLVTSFIILLGCSVIMFISNFFHLGAT